MADDIENEEVKKPQTLEEWLDAEEAKKNEIQEQFLATHREKLNQVYNGIRQRDDSQNVDEESTPD